MVVFINIKRILRYNYNNAKLLVGTLLKENYLSKFIEIKFIQKDGGCGAMASIEDCGSFDPGSNPGSLTMFLRGEQWN